MASLKRMIQSGIHFSKLRVSTTNRVGASANSYCSLSSNSSDYKLDYGQISPNEKRVYHVDTHALIRSLEAQGLPSKHAEAITSAVTLVLNVSSGHASQNFISKAEMQKIVMTQEGNFSKFKSEVLMTNEGNFSKLQSSQFVAFMQDHHFLLLQREVDKLKNDNEKMRGELRYEIDKAIAGQRLDLNLEKRHIQEELGNMRAEITNLNNKLDNKLEKEIHALKTYVEAAKNDGLKYILGVIISASAVCIGLVRIFTTKQ